VRTYSNPTSISSLASSTFLAVTDFPRKAKTIDALYFLTLKPMFEQMEKREKASWERYLSRPKEQTEFDIK
jgi:hypothetical protein